MIPQGMWCNNSTRNMGRSYSQVFGLREYGFRCGQAASCAWAYADDAGGAKRWAGSKLLCRASSPSPCPFLDFAGLRWLGNKGMGGIGAQGISGMRLQEEVIEGLCVPWNLLER